jgi:hypothetical protein
VQITQIVTVLSALLAISPKIAATFGSPTPTQIEFFVETIFGSIAFFAPLVGTWLRARSTLQPLTLTKAGAAAHPQTQAAVYNQPIFEAAPAPPPPHMAGLALTVDKSKPWGKST